MKYTCLIYDKTPAAVYTDEYFKLIEEAVKAGVMRGGAELQSPAVATTVQLRDGKRILTDGPFAESKDIVNGYMIFECASLDEALEWAARIPGARNGVVEVRPEVVR